MTAARNNSPPIFRLPAGTMPGPGHMPLNPQPTPKIVAPTTRRRVILKRLGSSNVTPRSDRRCPRAKANAGAATITGVHHYERRGKGSNFRSQERRWQRGPGPPYGIEEGRIRKQGQVNRQRPLGRLIAVRDASPQPPNWHMPDEKHRRRRDDHERKRSPQENGAKDWQGRKRHVRWYSQIRAWCQRQPAAPQRPTRASRVGGWERPERCRRTVQQRKTQVGRRGMSNATSRAETELRHPKSRSPRQCVRQLAAIRQPRRRSERHRAPRP